MNIAISCSDNPTYRLGVVVHALSFNVASNSFSMPCPRGDDWLQRLTWSNKPPPTAMHFHTTHTCVVFARQTDAEAFGVWLAKSEVEAQHGYKTMRG